MMQSISRLSSSLSWTMNTSTGIAIGIAAISAVAFAIFYAIREIRKPLPPFQLNDSEKTTFRVLFSKSAEELDQIPFISKDINANAPLVKGVARNGQPFFRIEVFLKDPKTFENQIEEHYPKLSKDVLNIRPLIQHIFLERNPNGTWSQKFNEKHLTPLYFTTPFTDEQGECVKNQTAISSKFKSLYALIHMGISSDIHLIQWQFRTSVGPSSPPILLSSALVPQPQQQK